EAPGAMKLVARAANVHPAIPSNANAHRPPRPPCFSANQHIALRVYVRYCTHSAGQFGRTSARRHSMEEADGWWWVSSQRHERGGALHAEAASRRRHDAARDELE